MELQKKHHTKKGTKTTEIIRFFCLLVFWVLFIFFSDVLSEPWLPLSLHAAAVKKTSVVKH